MKKALNLITKKLGILIAINKKVDNWNNYRWTNKKKLTKINLLN